jgi:hypothetical protein
VIVASGRGHADGFDGKLVRHKVEKIHEEPSLVVRRYCFRSNQMLAEIRKKSRNGFVSSPSLADRRDACNLGECSKASVVNNYEDNSWAFVVITCLFD